MEDLVEQNYNYNTPLELTEIHRTPKPDGGMEELAAKFVIGWEEIRMIEQYAYKDDWSTYKGEKYFLITTLSQPKLILGSYSEIKQYWTNMRERYPLFVQREQY